MYHAVESTYILVQDEFASP